MRWSRRAGVLALSATMIGACSDPVDTDPTETPASEDHEFDGNSRIASQDLTPIQVESLALLAKVWGFAKYHHPRVVAGSRNWDYDLFRAIPLMLGAPDRATASVALVTWLDGIGSIPACSPCAQPPGEAQLLPDIGWIENAADLPAGLSDRLLAMHRNRPVTTAQRYVAFNPSVGNPDFSAEARYPNPPTPDAGYRLLALFRFWNIIEYWFPYRDVIGEDWDGVLREFIPLMMQPMGGDAYRSALMRLSARVHDGHAALLNATDVLPPTGTDAAPFLLRFLNGRPVVTAYADPQSGLDSELRPGDEIHTVDGVSVESLVDSMRPYYPASNEPARLRDIAPYLTRGTGGAVRLDGIGATGPFSTSVRRVPMSTLSYGAAYTHELPGPTFRLLTDSVAYLKASSAERTRAAEYITQAQGAAVLVIDIRSYPTEFIVFDLGGHLVAAPEPFARFTTADPANPGAFLWAAPNVHSPREPRFTGKVVILVDEVTQSAAEYAAMAFRAAPGAIVAGSTTAGADGNVSSIPLPGGKEARISGLGVFYPDGRPTQRVGIVPDLVVYPTPKGIRDGRDEVLEAGVSFALGREWRLPDGAGGGILARAAH